MSEARIWAQAKINLALRVLSREAGGYHSIETIFQRLDVGDDIVVRISGTQRSIDCRGADVGPAEKNLAWRAAVAYADATGWPSGFAIEVDKHIPVGGGLGGGSADAGAVLRALDGLAPTPLGPRLLELAATLGSDVPFLATEQTVALGWGRGERLLALPALPPRPVALVFPPFSVSTADAYGWIAETRGPLFPRGSLLTWGDLSSWNNIARVATNEFEPVVASRHPEIASYIDALRNAGAEIAMMSGSGSTFFGIFTAKPNSAELASTTRARVLVTRTAERVVGVERTQ